MKKEIVDNDKIMIIVNEIGEEDKTIEDLKIDYPKEIEKLEEAFSNSIGENDPKLLKSEFPDKWKFLNKKIANRYEYFIKIEDYQKPVDNLKKEYFFSKLKNDYPDDEETERTKQIIKLFNKKSGKEINRSTFKK